MKNDSAGLPHCGASPQARRPSILDLRTRACIEFIFRAQEFFARSLLPRHQVLLAMAVRHRRNRAEPQPRALPLELRVALARSVQPLHV